MKRSNIVVSVFIIVLILVAGGIAAWTWKSMKDSGTVSQTPAGGVASQNPNPTSETPTSTPAQNTTGLSLTLPASFNISVFAKDLPGARIAAFDGLGNMWVSQTSQGTISQIEIKGGKVVSQRVVFKNLKRPHGLAFSPEEPNVLYFAEENKISKVALYTEDSPHKIVDLPLGGRHFTRTLVFGSDGKLYVSIGSTCDVCNEKDSQMATVYRLNKDGSGWELFSKGLRNTVGLAVNPSTKELWGVDNGRDGLGTDQPPDEINILKQGSDYGWPICYGKNIHDTNFDKNVYIRDPCADKQSSFIDLPAHSAPLGLAFIPSSWPAAYKGSLLVATHGSMDTKNPAGYKILLVKLSGNGAYAGTEDFISGFITNTKQVQGRPVSVVFGQDGSLYITDDKEGQIYKVSYAK